MITLKYGYEIENEELQLEIKKIINQIYKLLPMREEGTDWTKPLQTIMIQLRGLNNLLETGRLELFPAICKLEGLSTLVGEEDFILYRRTIFECLNLLSSFKKNALGLE